MHKSGTPSSRTENVLLLVTISFSFIFAGTTLAFAQTTDLPDVVNGVTYSVQLKFLAVTPINATVPGDKLPEGLLLSRDGLLSGTPTINKDQEFRFTVTVIDSSEPPQTQKLEFHLHGRTAAQPVQVGAAGMCKTSSGSTGTCGGPWLRTIVGFEQAGVSSAQSQQNFFLDIYYDRPLLHNNDIDLGPALRSWGDLRISSVPQQISTDVATFAAGFAEKVGQLKVNEVAQAFEFLGGLQYRFGASRRRPGYASTDPHDTDVHARVSGNLILGGGVITPLSPKQSVQLFAVPSNQPAFFQRYPEASGKQFVAFTLSDRDRFFRQAYGGIRLMTHFIGDTRVRAPETFDLTYGFNESITGGRIHGGVMRLEGFVPIPYDKLTWLYLFGTGMFKPGAHATIAHPFLLDSAPTGILPTNQNAVVITTPQADRDYYRVGFGVDFVELIQVLRKPQQANQNQPHQNQPPAGTPSSTGITPAPTSTVPAPQ